MYPNDYSNIRWFLIGCSFCWRNRWNDLFTVLNLASVAVAWSVETLPSNPVARVRSPAESAILISILRLRKAMGSYRTYLSLVKLLPWFLRLQWKTCPWGEHSDDDDPRAGCVLCVLSCLVSGCGSDIVLTTHSRRSALVYLSSVLVHSLLLHIEAPTGLGCKSKGVLSPTLRRGGLNN